MENSPIEIETNLFNKIYDLLSNMINIETLKKRIIEDNETINQINIFKNMISSFTNKDIIGNEEIFNFSYNTKVNTKDLFELTFDFYKKQDKRIFEIFEKFFNDRQNNVFFTSTPINNDFDGATFQFSGIDKVFIHINSHEDIRDVPLLIHEYGHAIAFYLNGFDNIKYNSFEPFSEIESIFFEILSFDYLDSIHLDDIDSYNKRKSYLVNLFCNAAIIENKFLIYNFIHTILNDKINYRAIKKEYYINKSDLKNIYSSSIETKLKYVISSLYAMELYDIYLKNPDKAFNLYKKIITLNYPTYEEYINELSNLYLFPNETDTFIRTLKKDAK
ncbi:MAG: hypothetical protein ACI4XR_00340 [Bacilli bacterium]